MFIHQSDAVYNITFDDSETIGVTYQHPIYTVTVGDWRLAGELEIGEKVLTKRREVTVTASEKKGGYELVYNLEVKDWHNFLVGNEGVVVHNGCWSSKLQKYGKRAAAKYQKAIDHVWEGHNPLSKVAGKSYFKESLDDKIKLKKYIKEAQGKGQILSEIIITRDVDDVTRKYMIVV